MWRCQTPRWQPGVLVLIFCFINIFPACQFSKWSQTHLHGSWGIKSPSEICHSWGESSAAKQADKGEKEEVRSYHRIWATAEGKRIMEGNVKWENVLLFLKHQLRPWSSGHSLIKAYTPHPEKNRSLPCKTCCDGFQFSSLLMSAFKKGLEIH